MSKQQVQVNRDVLVQVLDVLVRASSYYDTYEEIDALRAALEQQTEPVAWRAVGGSIWGHKGNEDDTPLYDHPPRREWRGLTDEERRECTASPFVVDNYRAIEAALKEKNNG